LEAGGGSRGDLTSLVKGLRRTREKYGPDDVDHSSAAGRLCAPGQLVVPVALSPRMVPDAVLVGPVPATAMASVNVTHPRGKFARLS
jgi:hypothetical protein